MTGWVRKESATGKIVKSFGEHPAGIVIYTKGGHFVTFAAGQDRQKPAQAIHQMPSASNFSRRCMGLVGPIKSRATGDSRTSTPREIIHGPALIDRPRSSK